MNGSKALLLQTIKLLLTTTIQQGTDKIMVIPTEGDDAHPFTVIN